MDVSGWAHTIEVGRGVRAPSRHASPRVETDHGTAALLLTSGSDKGDMPTVDEDPAGELGVMDKGPTFCDTHGTRPWFGDAGDKLHTPCKPAAPCAAPSLLGFAASAGGEHDEILDGGSASSLRPVP